MKNFFYGSPVYPHINDTVWHEGREWDVDFVSEDSIHLRSKAPELIVEGGFFKVRTVCTVVRKDEMGE